MEYIFIVYAFGIAVYAEIEWVLSLGGFFLSSQVLYPDIYSPETERHRYNNVQRVTSISYSFRNHASKANIVINQ
jgi:hypothetical protein